MRYDVRLTKQRHKQDIKQADRKTQLGCGTAPCPQPPLPSSMGLSSAAAVLVIGMCSE